MSTTVGTGGIVLGRTAASGTLVVFDGAASPPTNFPLTFNTSPLVYGFEQWQTYNNGDSFITTWTGPVWVRMIANLLLESTSADNTFVERYNGCVYPLVNGARVTYQGEEQRSGGTYLRSNNAVTDQFWIGADLLIPVEIAASSQLSAELVQVQGTSANADELRLLPGSTIVWERVK